jgi:hypothetical protein
MTRKFGEWAVADALPGMLFGRGTAGNVQVPLTLLQTYVQRIIASTASNSGGGENFRGAWAAENDYAPGDLISYQSRVYLLIAPAAYLSSTTPDQDSTNWLCLYGQMVNAVDLNDVPNMAYFYSANSDNAPSAETYGYGYTIFHGTGYAVQLYWGTDGMTQYVRVLNDKTWGPWFVQAAAFQKTQVPGGEGSGAIWASASNNAEFVSTIKSDTTLNISGWATVTDKMQRLRWEVINGGAFKTTWGPYNNLKWVKPDGTLTTDFTQLGITWNVSGSNFFEFWTRDSGATVYGRALVS